MNIHGRLQHICEAPCHERDGALPTSSDVMHELYILHLLQHTTESISPFT